MTNMLFYTIKKILCFAKRVIKILLRVFLPNIIYSNLTCLRFFERIQIKNNSGTSKLVCVFGIPVLQYANIDGKKKILLPAKKQIDKTQPVFYLKINRRDDYVFLCLQHWIDTISSMNRDYYILCDNKKLEKEVIKRIVFPDSNIKFIKSCKNKKLKKIVDKIATKFWLKATYAHLTTFYHASQNNSNAFWNIDADDTLFCIDCKNLVKILQGVEFYAKENDLNIFSFDMHTSRTQGKHWSFGITYTRNNIDWFGIFDNIKDSNWMNNYSKYENEFNLDWFFTDLRNQHIAKCETFYVENICFIHFGDIVNNPIYAWIGEYSNQRIKFPILLDLYGSKKYGDIAIHKDVIKLDSGINLVDCDFYMSNEYNYLDTPTKQHDNLWGM